MTLAARSRWPEGFLVWRGGPRRPRPRNDAALLFLVARAQSLSGRPHDAIVMLQRLLSRGIDLTDAESAMTSAGARARRVDGPRRAHSRNAHPSLGGTHGPGEASSGSPRNARPRQLSVVAARTPAAAAAGPPSAAKTPARTLAPAACNERRAKNRRGEPIAASPPALRAVAMACDRVSGRILLADDDTETLKVLSELSGTAVNLVSRGWGGPYRTTAIAIDSARGDLWVAATARDPGSRPHLPSSTACSSCRDDCSRAWRRTRIKCRLVFIARRRR